MTSWAKAPDHHDPAAVAANTREFLEHGLVPVACHACTTRVRVRKASAVQTSVQWSTDPAATCPEFAALVATGEVGARIDTCPKLRESIADAASSGRLAVPDA